MKETELLKRRYIPALRVITKPFDSFEQIKEKGCGAVWQIAVPVLLFFLARIFNLVFGGFLFNETELSSVNLPVEFAAVVGIYALFVFANKNFCDLSDGDGHMVEVALAVSFALLPYTMASFLNVLLSNVFLLREQAFLGMISAAVLIWSGFVGLVGLKAVHRYSFSKTVVTLLVTALFMTLIAFLGAIIFLITQQLVLFFKDIYNEIVFRM